MHIIPALGTKKLDKLTAKNIRSWLDRIAGQCRCCTQRIDAKRTADKQRCCALGNCCRLLPAPRRLQYYHGVLAVTLAHAVREDMIPRNVAKQVQVPSGPPRRYDSRGRWCTGAHVAGVSSAHGVPYGAAIRAPTTPEATRRGRQVSQQSAVVAAPALGRIFTRSGEGQNYAP